MLRWRIPLAVLFIAILAALGYADAQAARPGIYLAPLAVLLAGLATGEMLRLFRAGLGPGCLSTPGLDSGKVYYFATLLPVLTSCAPLAWKEYPEDCPVGRLGWLALGLLAGLLVIVLREMKSFQAEGQSITRLALGSLCVLYVGGLFGMIVQLRLISGTEALPGGKRGLVALLSMIAIVKASDIGQYTFGRLLGKHKLAPALSPGKTWEGALGGVATAIAVATLGREPSLITKATPVETVALVPLALYASSLAVAGILGDLAESLLKRAAGVKDSSDWLPGFGGILDLVD
ncbi:MAG: phosphatidate cytidylyltransferase, partial [Lacipirellulaceae bacterium]